MEFAGGHLDPFARTGFTFRDDGAFSGAFDAFGEQGVDGFVVAYLNGSSRGGVLGEHEAFSFSRFLRYFRVFLLVMRAGAIQTVYVRVSYPLRTSHIVSYGSVSLHCEKRQEIFEQLCMN